MNSADPFAGFCGSSFRLALRHSPPPASILAVVLALAVSPPSAHAAPAPVEPCRTQVGGMVANQTWTRNDSPYCVTNDVYVSGTLTIREGVEVRFQGNHVFEVGGRLRAVGTAEAPIQFHPADEAVGWQGLLFRDAVPGSFFVHTIIEGSKNSGVRITNAPPAFTNCVVRNNTAPDKGGGISAEIPAGDLILASCQITNNRTTGGSANGGGISAAMTSGKLRLISSLVAENRSSVNGAGVFLRGHGEFSDCVFSRNQLTAASNAGGGIGAANTVLTLLNCDLSANAAQYGGALYATTGTGQSSVRLFNCRLFANRATRAGGGILIEYKTYGEVMNSVLTANQPEAIQVWNDVTRLAMTNSIVFLNAGGAADGGAIGGSPSSIAVAYCNIQNKVWPGPGNISVAPALCPDTFSLIEGSPCIDAGHPGLEFRDGCRSDEPCSPFARGGPRNDMGAYGGPGVCYFTQPRAEPVIRIAPDNEIGFEGQPTRLGVIATGADALVYQWFKNGTSLPGQTNMVLNLSRTTLPDAGTYAVKVTNPLGEAETTPVQLGVAKYEAVTDGASNGRPQLLIRNGKAGDRCTIYSVNQLAPGDTTIVPGTPPDAWELRETLVFDGPEVRWTDPRVLGAGEVRYYGVVPAP